MDRSGRDQACAAGKALGPGFLTAFHLSRSKQESAGVISLYWTRANNQWRIVSFHISED